MPLSRTHRLVHHAVAIWLMAVIAGACQPVRSGDVYLPGRDDPLRLQLLNVVRPLFARETKGAVQFVVRRLAVKDHWAFGHVVVQRPGGQKIDWRKTKYAEALSDGMFDPDASFFLLRRTKKGWRIYDYALGPTDVVWDGWRQDLGLPVKLFQGGMN